MRLLPPILPAYSNSQCLGFQLWCLESAFCKVALVTLLPLLLGWNSLISRGQELYYIVPYPPQCFEHSMFIKSSFMVWFLFTLAKCIYSFSPSLNICWVPTGSWVSCCPHFFYQVPVSQPLLSVAGGSLEALCMHSYSKVVHYHQGLK